MTAKQPPEAQLATKWPKMEPHTKWQTGITDLAPFID